MSALLSGLRVHSLCQFSVSMLHKQVHPCVDWTYYKWYSTKTRSNWYEFESGTCLSSFKERSVGGPFSCFDHLVYDVARHEHTGKCLPQEAVHCRYSKLSRQLLSVLCVLLARLVLRVCEHMSKGNCVGGHHASWVDVPEGLSDFVCIAQQADGSVSPYVHLLVLLACWAILTA